MRNKLLLPPRSMGDGAYIPYVGHIIACLTDNPYFPLPWIPQVPSLVEIIAAYEAYQDAYHAALNRDLIKIDQRNTARETLNTMLVKLVPYLEMVADDDVIKLKSTGFGLRAEPTHTTQTDPLPAPSDFRVKHGAVSGTLDLHIAKLAGAGNYEVQISLAIDPSDESCWVHNMSSLSSQHITVRGLTPGQAVWVRVRGIGSNGNGLWTAPLRIIVV